MAKTLHVHPTLNKGYGWKQPKLPTHRFPMRAPRFDAGALPPSVDLRPECPPVYDQGQLGSCTANAWAGVGEFLQMQEKIPSYVPSRLFIYYCERAEDGDVEEDAGSSLSTGANVVSREGCPNEALWPYDISKFTEQPPQSAYAAGKQNLVLAPQQVQQSLQAMKEVLAVDRVPIAIGFTVYESFESDAVASTGIVPMPGRREQAVGGHAVDIVGYVNKQARFICRNSWGTGWGMAGYFEIPYLYLTSPMLASDFWMATKIA